MSSLVIINLRKGLIFLFFRVKMCVVKAMIKTVAFVFGFRERMFGENSCRAYVNTTYELLAVKSYAVFLR